MLQVSTYLKIYLSDLPFVSHQWEGIGSPSAFCLSLTAWFSLARKSEWL